MGKIKRGNFIFVSWIGDHGHHVHVYRDRRQVLKWDLDEKRPIAGRASKKMMKIMEALIKEGLL